MKKETTLQWAIRTAKERREKELLNNPQPPTPIQTPKFVRVDYGYFKWDGGYDKYKTMIKAAYDWGIKNNKTKSETAKKFNTYERNLSQYAINHQLPKLKD